jgi:hypothetical protein
MTHHKGRTELDKVKLHAHNQNYYAHELLWHLPRINDPLTFGIGTPAWVVHSVLSYVGSRSIQFNRVVHYLRLNYVSYVNRPGFEARFNGLGPAW